MPITHSTSFVDNVTVLNAAVFNADHLIADLIPDSAGDHHVGSATKEWLDLFIADSGILYFGNDQEVTLTHVPDVGLLLNAAMQLQFRDSGVYVSSKNDGYLDLNADTGIRLNGAVGVDHIDEITPAHGVVVDGVTIQDGGLTIGGIIYRTSASDYDFAKFTNTDTGGKSTWFSSIAASGFLIYTGNAGNGATLRMQIGWGAAQGSAGITMYEPLTLSGVGLTTPQVQSVLANLLLIGASGYNVVLQPVGGGAAGIYDGALKLYHVQGASIMHITEDLDVSGGLTVGGDINVQGYGVYNVGYLAGKDASGLTIYAENTSGGSTGQPIVFNVRDTGSGAWDTALTLSAVVSGNPLATFTGGLTAVAVYSVVVGGTNRDLYIDDSGVIGYVSSSIRYKENIVYINDANWLYGLQPVTFDRKDGSRLGEWGLIAEDVAKVAPNFVSYDDDGMPETVSYGCLISPIIVEIKNLKTRVDNLNARIATLERLKMKNG
jgi:hypothetical protein